jgi:hypothetical protein
MDAAFSRFINNCNHHLNHQSFTGLRATGFARLYSVSAKTLSQCACERIGVFAPPSMPSFSRLIEKKWKDVQISVEK